MRICTKQIRRQTFETLTNFFLISVTYLDQYTDKNDRLGLACSSVRNTVYRFKAHMKHMYVRNITIIISLLS